MGSPFTEERVSVVGRFPIAEFAGLKPRIGAETIVFVHLGGCGGLTFSDVFYEMYSGVRNFMPVGGSFPGNPPEFSGFPDERKRRYRAIHGHYNFGVHTVLPQSCAYVTVLRDPVEQFISGYYYSRRHFLADGSKAEEGRFATLGEYADDVLKRRTNAQGAGYIIHFLAHPLDPPWTDERCDWRALTEDGQTKMVCDKLDGYFPFVGITERFEETLFMLAYMLGWDKLPYWRRFASTKGRPKRAEHDALTLRKVAQAVGVSSRIYEKYAKNFDESYRGVCKRFPALEERVEEYRRARPLNLSPIYL